VSRVIWSPQALHDLESIRDFIARDSPLYAGLVIQRLVASVERLGAFPKSGRVVPELGRSDVREVIQPPFRIVYRLSGDGVEVATVFRSSRLFRGAE
jgi:plasmid stabilization system protein ParE